MQSQHASNVEYGLSLAAGHCHVELHEVTWAKRSRSRVKCISPPLHVQCLQLPSQQERCQVALLCAYVQHSCWHEVTSKLTKTHEQLRTALFDAWKLGSVQNDSRQTHIQAQYDFGMSAAETAGRTQAYLCSTAGSCHLVLGWLS